MNNYIFGQRALITGASAGIGAEFARQLHAKGAEVILLARRADKLKELCNALNSIRPNSAFAICADLKLEQATSPDILGLKEIVDYVQSTRIDILINNAGIGSFGYFDSIAVQNEIDIIKLNILATTVIAQACVAKMKERRSGALVNIASVAAFVPLPFMSTYAASKVFNRFQAQAVRQELREYNVRALTVCPGPTATEFFGVARVPGSVTGVKRDRVEDVVAQSISALEKDRGVVVTGWRSKLMAISAIFLPTTISTWLVKKALLPIVTKNR